MDSVLLGFSGGAFTSSAVPCELELGAGSASPLYRTAPRRQSSHELGSRSDKKKVLVVDDVPVCFDDRFPIFALSSRSRGAFAADLERS